MNVSNITKAAALGAVLAGFAASAIAAPGQWALLNAKNSSARIYVDRASAKQGLRANSRKVWVLVDYNSMQGSGASQYISIKYQTEFDCDTDEAKLLQSVTYAGVGGNGSVVGTYPVQTPVWKPVVEKSVNAVVLSDVCRR
jgi:hypothetical protein